MVLTIMQPAYLPWLGFFHRISLSDQFVVLDHVAIDKNSRTNFASRNRVRTKDGWTWLTVPLRTAGRHDDRQLNRLEIANDSNWSHKHRTTLRAAYGKTPFWSDHEPFFDSLYSKSHSHLFPLVRELMEYLLSAFGVTVPIHYSSDLALQSQKGDLILEICQKMNATTYVSGPFGRDYLDLAAFDQAGVKVAFHDYRHPVYPQAYAGFEPFMAAIDLLCNCGPASLAVLRENQEAL